MNEHLTRFTIRDPFAGDLEIHGATIEDAISRAYRDIPREERPTRVWHGEDEFPVPGGMAAEGGFHHA